MRVYIFGIHQGALVQAMQEGIEKHGHQVILRAQAGYRDNNYEPCDIAVVFGLHRPGDLILEEHRAHGTPVLVIDYGYVKRGTLMYSKVDERFYYSASLNGLNGRSDPFPSPMSGERWNQLETPLQPWRTDGKYILACGQKQNDVSIGNLNPTFWAKQIIAQLQTLTNRPIVFRPHPEERSQHRPIGIPHDEHKTLAEALVNSFAVVSYNSNSLVEATIAGVPTFTLGKGSMVEGVTNTDLTCIDNPQTFDREQWAYDLAWRQFRIDEIRSGLLWEYAVEKTIPPREAKPAIDFHIEQKEENPILTKSIETEEVLSVDYEERIPVEKKPQEQIFPIVTKDEDGIVRGIETEEFVLTEIQYEGEEKILPPEEFFEKNVISTNTASPVVRKGRPRKK